MFQCTRKFDDQLINDKIDFPNKEGRENDLMIAKVKNEFYSAFSMKLGKNITSQNSQNHIDVRIKVT